MLRVRDISGLRAGAKRDPAGARLLLPDATAQWRHLAHRGYAVGAPIRVPLPTTDPRDQLAAVHPHPGLAHH